MRNKKACFQLTSLILIFIIGFSSCSEKRLTYVQMVKREKTEIEQFLKKRGIQIIAEIPDKKVMDENTFTPILEGVYLRIIDPGKDKPQSGKTIIHARCNVRSLSSRDNFKYDNFSPTTGGTAPITFLYNDQRDVIIPDPKASIDEQVNERLACAAMQEALKYVGNGAQVQLIVTFREGPTFTAREGVPLYFETLSFQFKQ